MATLFTKNSLCEKLRNNSNNVFKGGYVQKKGSLPIITYTNLLLIPPPPRRNVKQVFIKGVYFTPIVCVLDFGWNWSCTYLEENLCGEHNEFYIILIKIRFLIPAFWSDVVTFVLNVICSLIVLCQEDVMKCTCTCMKTNLVLSSVERGKTREPRKKPWSPWIQDEFQQQTQPMFDARPRLKPGPYWLGGGGGRCSILAITVQGGLLIKIDIRKIDR